MWDLNPASNGRLGSASVRRSLGTMPRSLMISVMGAAYCILGRAEIFNIHFDFFVYADELSLF